MVDPGGCCFSAIKERCIDLKSLHLCKIADSFEYGNIETHNSSQFNKDEISHEWADFLDCVSGSVVYMTLEDCYLVTDHWRFFFRKMDSRPGGDDARQ